MSDTRALVLVTTSFPIRGDGSEAAGSFVSDLAEELAQHVPVRVVAPGSESIREKWAVSVDVFRYASPEKPLSTLKPWKPQDFFQMIRVLRAGTNATRCAVAAGPTAHILALWVLPSGYWARGAARSIGVPYSVWALGSDIWSLARIPGIRTILRSVIRGAANRYADGLELGEDAARISGRPFAFLPSTRCLEGHRSRSLASSPPYRLLFLGRWHPNKGIDLLLDALAMLDADDWKRIASVEICGGGPLELLVKAGVGALRAAGRPVELRGYLDKAAAADAIIRADYLLIPSRIESIPVVFSDAMKLDCPVVSMPTGDLSALVANEPRCGVVASEISAPAFALALSSALSQAPAEFSTGMIARAEQFDLGSGAWRVLAGMGMTAHA